MKLIYIGHGSFIPGVPARDLDEEDLKQLEIAVDILLQSKLYKVAEEQKMLTKKYENKTANEEN